MVLQRELDEVYGTTPRGHDLGDLGRGLEQPAVGERRVDAAGPAAASTASVIASPSGVDGAVVIGGSL